MCRQTDNCVESFDHFCPWVGNAVGRRNYALFVSFVSSVCLLALAVGATSVVTLAAPPPARNATHGAGLAGTALVSRGLGAVVLCLYTSIVLCSVSAGCVGLPRVAVGDEAELPPLFLLVLRSAGCGATTHG